MVISVTAHGIARVSRPWSRKRGAWGDAGEVLESEGQGRDSRSLQFSGWVSEKTELQ